MNNSKHILHLGLALIAGLVAFPSCSSRQQSSTAISKAPAITAGEHTRVKTIYGPIEGYLDGGIYTFKGIKYAKADRFMPPQDPDTFTDLRMCKLYGPQAPQSETLMWNDDTQRDYSFGNQFFLEAMDEKDCLVLNVWTPSINDGKKRPVFFWIHGGGYFSGSGHDLPCYEGKALAEKGDIVVVNINHRLNVLGYADLTALGGRYSQSVNLGMQDIVKALEWVNKNIDRFGGDPGNVTIAGQSGGGGKVSTLLAMPSAKGLFQKAIVQSGSTLRQTEKEVSQAYGLEFVKELGVDPKHPEKLDTFTYDELVAAGQRAATKMAATTSARVGFGPSVDGTILPTHPFDGAASECCRNIPMLIGTNFNEFTFDVNVNMNAGEIDAALTKQVGAENVEAFKAAFKTAYPDAPAEAMTYIDLGFRTGAVKQAQLKSEQGGAPAYLYLFAWKPETNALGASHGMELPFMFNNVNVQREMTGSTESAYIFEDAISDTWLSFIKTGNPNNAKIPVWEPYNNESSITMVLDNNFRAVSHLDEGLLKFGTSRF